MTLSKTLFFKKIFNRKCPASKQKSSSISQGKIIKNQGGNPEEIQILQWSGKDIKIIVISMFKNLNDEIENCTGN